MLLFAPVELLEDSLGYYLGSLSPMLCRDALFLCLAFSLSDAGGLFLDALLLDPRLLFSLFLFSSSSAFSFPASVPPAAGDALFFYRSKTYAHFKHCEHD